MDGANRRPGQRVAPATRGAGGKNEHGGILAWIPGAGEAMKPMLPSALITGDAHRLSWGVLPCKPRAADSFASAQRPAVRAFQGRTPLRIWFVCVPRAVVKGHGFHG
jgi:hypothetical protein